MSGYKAGEISSPTATNGFSELNLAPASKEVCVFYNE